MSKHEHGNCCEKGEHSKRTEGEEHHEAHAKSGDSGSMTKIIYGLMLVLVFLMGFNQMLISGIAGGAPATGGQSGSAASAAPSVDLSSADTQAIVAATIPTGTPEYGASAKASFDNPVQSISVLAGYENSVTLSDSEMRRYISIAGQISCEYCCGANSIIDSKGRAACGCAHSAAMRGLGKWLIKNRPGMSDDAILEELGKWKTLFFPKDSIKKALLLKANDIPFSYVNLQSNKYRNIAAPTTAAAQSSQQQSAGNLGALPSQVGGC